MEKRLKRYTTIPQHLYVNRSADEQLKRIVDEMQRPGYVLVARQMGKTNLLFNAKRTLENDSRLFVYVDLSNLFEYEYDCYRNIIDTILEPNENLFNSIEKDIEVLREKKLPPHKEYSRSLRIILNHFQGDVVIILDEIDALKSAKYSDNIFAQIRSNYFSRTNFPVFERLTYILSGVIEPTELIKDRNKSPFNIGEKIYLDDFSFDEHNSFIQKSELTLSDEVSNEIYNWTKGNPRLTFDICSSIESLIIEKKEITIERLKKLIKQKYLTSFDIAPIDHIRELIKTDKKARNAVLSIQQNKQSELSDEIKKKLYLFGIINSKFDEVTSIKNPIIKDSLSENWIKSIDKQTQDNYSYGLDKMNQSEFKEAISALSEFIENSNPTKNQIEICNYNIGFAHYSLRNFKNAIEYFSKIFSLPLYKNSSKSLLGVCKLGIGQEEEGIEILEKIIKQKAKDFAFRNAVLNLAPLIAKTDKIRALDLYKELYESTFENEDEISNEELNQIRTLAFYYQAEIFLEGKDNEKALKGLDDALKYATSSDSLYLKFLKYNLSKNNNENIKFEIIDSIIEQNLNFDTKNSYPINFSEKHIFLYLDLSFDSLNLKQFEKLLDYSYHKLFNKKISKYQIAYSLSNVSAQRKELLIYILDNETNVSNSVLLKVYQDLSFFVLPIDKHKKFFTYFNKYKALFLELDKVTVSDIHTFAVAIKQYSDANKIQEGIKLCQTIEHKVYNLKNEELKLESVIIYYWYSTLNFSLKKNKEAVAYADKAIQLVKEFKKERTSMIDEKGLKSIVEQMKQIKNSIKISTPFIKEKTYRRNQRVKVKYKDGLIKEGKHKTFEADIIAERCVII